MAGSNVVAIRGALFQLLGARAALRKVQVLYSWTGKIEREAIYLGDGRFDHEFAAASPARKPRNETGSVDVHIVVRAPDHDVQAAEQRAVEYGTVLEELLADDVTLGGAVSLAWVSSGELSYALDDDGAVVLLSYAVYFKSFYLR